MDYTKETILCTDSSGIGIGGTLAQIDPKDKTETAIAYYSRVLQPHEVNYDITSREALAVLSTVRNFATYLRFTRFKIMSDHNDLKYIFKVQKTKQESHRLIRWALYLSGFDFTIQFTSGNSPEIRMSDFLSCYEYEEKASEIGEIARSLSVKELEHLESQCPDCRVQEGTKIAEPPDQIIPNIQQLQALHNGQLSEQDMTIKRIQSFDPDISFKTNNLPYLKPGIESDGKDTNEETTKINHEEVDSPIKDNYEETMKEDCNQEENEEDVTPINVSDADIEIEELCPPTSSYEQRDHNMTQEEQEREEESLCEKQDIDTNNEEQPTDYLNSILHHDDENEAEMNFEENDLDRQEREQLARSENYVLVEKIKEKLDSYEIKGFSRDQLREL